MANLGDRIALRAHVRHQMTARGYLTFCDEEPRDERAWEGFRSIQSQWAGLCQAEGYRESLLKEGIAASSTDHEQQSIEATLHPNHGEFWSSTGSTGHTEECLLYAMASHSVVRFARLAFYRASYQHGDPVYPSLGVSFYVGPSPTQMHLASPVYATEASDRLQVFPLSHTAPPGSYFAVRFHAKTQRQWEDNQFYIAVRHMSALGKVLPAHTLPNLHRAIRACNLQWGSSLPEVQVPQSGEERKAEEEVAARLIFGIPPTSKWYALPGVFSDAHARYGLSHTSASTDACVKGDQGQGLSSSSLIRALHSCHTHARATSCSGGGGGTGEARMEQKSREGEGELEGGVEGGDADKKPPRPKGATAVPVPSCSGEGAAAHGAQQGVGGVGTSGNGAGSSSGGSSGGGGADSSATDRRSWGRRALRGWVFGRGSNTDDDAQARARAVAEEEGHRARAQEEAVRQAALEQRANMGPLVANLIHWLLTRMQAAHPEMVEQAPGENMDYLEDLAGRLAEGGGEGDLPAGPFLMQQLLRVQSEILAEEEEQRQENAEQDVGMLSDTGEAEGMDVAEELEPTVLSSPGAEAGDAEAGAAQGMQPEQHSMQGWPISTKEVVRGQHRGAASDASVTTRLLAPGWTQQSPSKRLKVHREQQSPAALVLFGDAEGSQDPWPMSEYDIEFL